MCFGVVQIHSVAYASDAIVRVGQTDYYSFQDWADAGYSYDAGDSIYIYHSVEVVTPIVLDKSCTVIISYPANIQGHTPNSPTYSTVFLITAEGSAENPVSIRILSEDSDRRGMATTENADAIVIAENANNVNLTLTGLIITTTTSNGEDYSAIKVLGNANVNVNDCSVGDSNCDHAITKNNGNLRVNEGSFEAREDCFVVNAGENDISAAFAPEDVTSLLGYCLSANVVGDNSEVCDVRITNGQWHMAQSDNFNISEDFVEPFSFTLDGGGEFNRDETQYCAPGACTIMAPGSGWYSFANKEYFITYDFGAEGENEGTLSTDGISKFTARSGEILALKTVSRPDAHFDGWFENDEQISEIDTSLVSNFHDMTLVAHFTYYSASVSVDESISSSTNRDMMLAYSNIISNGRVCKEYSLTAINDGLLDTLDEDKLSALKEKIRDDNGNQVDFDNIENYSFHILNKVNVQSITIFNMVVERLVYTITPYVVAKAEDHSTLGTYMIEDFTEMFGANASLRINLPIPRNMNCLKVMLEHLEKDAIDQDFYDANIFDVQGSSNARYIQISQSVFNGNDYSVSAVQNLKNAIEHAENGAVITLESDYWLANDVEITINAGKSITLDTNNYNITGAGKVVFKVKGSLRVNGNSSDLQIRFVTAGDGASIVLEDGYYSLSENEYIIEARKEYANAHISVNKIYLTNENYCVVALFSENGVYEFARTLITAPFGINLGSGALTLGAGMNIHTDDMAVKVKQLYAANNVSLVVNDGRYVANNGYAIKEESTFIKSNFKTSIAINGGIFTGKVFSANCLNFIAGGIFSEPMYAGYLADEVFYLRTSTTYTVFDNSECYTRSSNNIKSLPKYFGEALADEYMQAYETIRARYEEYDEEAILDDVAEEAYSILLAQKEDVDNYNNACDNILGTMYYSDNPTLCDSIMEEYTTCVQVIESSAVYSGAINETAQTQFDTLVMQKEAYFIVEIPSVNLTNFVYNGVPQYYFTQVARGIIVTNNARQSAGSQIVTLELEDGYHWTDETTDAKEYVFSIKKADLILNNIYMLDKIVSYNGQVQSLVVEGNVPSYLRYEYVGNDKVNVGVYPVTVNFSLRDDVARNYNVPESLSATLRILKARYPVEGISFEDKSYDYDGKIKNLYVEGTLPEGITVRYVNNGQTKAGNYIVTAYFDLNDELSQNYTSPLPVSAHLVILSSMSESVSTWAFISIIAGVIMIVLGMLLLLALKKRDD